MGRSSTGSPLRLPMSSSTASRRLRSGGVAYLDATISGSSEQLRRGEALCMVGGDATDYAQCGELFQALGGAVRHVGKTGDGAKMKLVTNLVLGLNRAALAEGLALAEAMGLDLRRTLEVMQASAAYSRIMDSKGEKMITREFSPVARLSQHLKDVRLIQHAGESGGLRLPLTEAHRTLLEEGEASGLGAQDNSAIIEVTRSNPVGSAASGPSAKQAFQVTVVEILGDVLGDRRLACFQQVEIAVAHLRGDLVTDVE